MNLIAETMNNYSFNNQNIIYSSPLPNSEFVSLKSDIILRFNKFINPISLINNDIIEVDGSKSGKHIGVIKLADDAKTIIFKSEKPFDVNETIIVKLKKGLIFLDYTQCDAMNFSFSTIEKRVTEEMLAKVNANAQIQSVIPDKKKSLNNILEDNSLPAGFPVFTINTMNPDTNFLFISNFLENTPLHFNKYLLILDNQGNPFFYKELPSFALDFKMQPNGQFTYFDANIGRFIVMDSTFTNIDTIKCYNDISTNEHELLILPDGHYLLIGDIYETKDMSHLVPDGDTTALINDIVIQELDNNKELAFQWRSLDYYSIFDAAPDINLTGLTTPVDYAHTNALQLDNDGNIILSNRNMDEITKIDRQDGHIIWRWGGKHNEFTFINDTIRFSHQHAVRRIANGNITLFDNGVLHWNKLPSRALEYKLDETNKTAELVWQFVNDTTKRSLIMGYVQRLSNKSTLIGFGSGLPSVIELDSNNNKQFELTLPNQEWSYRAFRFNLSKNYYAPFVPNLEFPINNYQLSGDTVYLSWTRNKFANAFHVQISLDSTFNQLIKNDSNLVDNTMTVYGFAPNVKYYWRVAALNNSEYYGGYSGFTEVRNFKTKQIESVDGGDGTSNFSNINNFPNPFSDYTTFSFNLSGPCDVNIKIYNNLGEEITNLTDTYNSAGYYQKIFNSANLQNGIYYYDLIAGNKVLHGKMTLIR